MNFYILILYKKNYVILDGDIAQPNEVYHRLLNKTKHLDDISTDECMKITSSEIDDDIITTQESNGDSGFLPDLSQDQVFKNKNNTLLSNKV